MSATQEMEEGRDREGESEGAGSLRGALVEHAPRAKTMRQSVKKIDGELNLYSLPTAAHFWRVHEALWGDLVGKIDL